MGILGGQTLSRTVVSVAQLLRTLAAVLKCRRAAISPLTALMLIPISGAIAYSAEVGGWYYVQRSMQNAADSAAIAAATVNNSTTTGTTSLGEARAAAKQYGYTDGVNNTSVSAAPVTCPSGTASGATCYQATVSTVFPLLFSRVIGFNGNATYGTGRGQTISALAIATTAGGGTLTKQVCVLALGTGNSFTSNGGPKPDMSGCTIASNGNMTCNGHDLGADYGIAAGTDSGCGVNKVSNSTIITDPYSGKASNIPADSCTSYPQISTANLPASNQLSGNQTWSGNQPFCGDVQLAGDVTIKNGSDATMIIRNGMLDLNGHTLKTESGADVSIVFTGSNAAVFTGAYNTPKNKPPTPINVVASHYPTGSGTLDIQAPSSGAWSGVAIYQDPNLTQNVSFTYAGNNPTWNITGLVYLPKADVTYSGAVNKSSNGASCFILVAYSVLVNGTAYIFAGDNACAAAGLTPPTGVVGTGTTVREKLVL